MSDFWKAYTERMEELKKEELKEKADPDIPPSESGCWTLLSFPAGLVLVLAVTIPHILLISYTANYAWNSFLLPVFDFDMPMSVWVGQYILFSLFQAKFKPKAIEGWGATSVDKAATFLRWVWWMFATPLSILLIAWIMNWVF